jgi:hypothetical protein
MIRPSEFMSEVSNAAESLVQPHLVAIYDSAPDQVGTGFLTIWNAKPLLVTAKHTLYGQYFDQDPSRKQVHIGGRLRQLNELRISRIADNHDFDVALVHVDDFNLDRCLRYTALQFDAPPPQSITIFGFLERDFRRSEIEETLWPKPYLYTNSYKDAGHQRVGMEYTNRAVTTDTGKNEMAPIPRGLSGTVMLSTTALLTTQVKICGVFTEERLSDAYVFGTHVSVLLPLMESLLHK